MRIPRIHQAVALHSGATLSLDDDGANHVARVLRLKPGAPLTLFNGEGGEFAATLLSVERRRVEVEVGEHHPREVESPLAITLIQGVSKGERMDYTIQKAVELGVTRILPVFSERSVVSLDGKRADKRIEHWSKVIVSACEQCGRNRLPELGPLQTLTETLAAPRDGLSLMLDHREASRIGELPGAHNVTLLVGPEGGLSETERQAARQAGFNGLRLGPRVLRTETAALVAITALQARFGDLG